MDIKNKLNQDLIAHFPFKSFKPNQEQILVHLYQKKNILALMPTGAGKSLTYQLPAKLTRSLVLVISPLIALMQDQTQKAQEFGIKASFINSSLSANEREKRYLKLQNKEYQLLFVTPERFRKQEFIEAIQQNQVELLVIDEAHCISQWGHDFRPDYSKISEFHKLINSPQILALTATASQETQKDILQQLNLQNDMMILYGGIERDELKINMSDVFTIEDKIEQVLKNLDTKNGSQIIYFLTIQSLMFFSKELSKKKIEHKTYHGDLNSDQRRQSLNYFQKSENVLMLATPAFGLGIDKPNIRQVFHVELPGSIEAYFQEIGRAGRDGKPSSTYLFYSEDDLSISMEFIKWSHPENEFIKTFFNLISKNQVQFLQQGFNSIREQMSFKNKRDFRVEAAYNILERWGCLMPLSEVQNKTFVASGNSFIIREPIEDDFQKENQKILFQHQNKKLLQMFQLAQNEDRCRMGLIYEYFGSKYTECGLCDNCQRN